MKVRNLSFVVVLLLASPAQGQHPAHLLPDLRTAKGAIKPGTWVQYTIFQRANREVNAVRIAALERVAGKGQWFEIAITDQAQRTLVLKTLVAGTLSAPRGVLKTIIQPPGHQPVELPAGKQGAVKLPRMAPGPDPSARLMGTGKVKVAAGTFTCSRYRKVDKKGRVSQVWSSTDVPGWPMVKAESPDALIELSGFGKGATSKIRGKPGKLDPKLLEKIGLPR